MGTPNGPAAWTGPLASGRPQVGPSVQIGQHGVDAVAGGGPGGDVGLGPTGPARRRPRAGGGAAAAGRVRRVGRRTLCGTGRAHYLPRWPRSTPLVRARGVRAPPGHFGPACLARMRRSEREHAAEPQGAGRRAQREHADGRPLDSRGHRAARHPAAERPRSSRPCSRAPRRTAHRGAVDPGPPEPLGAPLDGRLAAAVTFVGKSPA